MDNDATQTNQAQTQAAETNLPELTTGTQDSTTAAPAVESEPQPEQAPPVDAAPEATTGVTITKTPIADE